MDQYWWSYFSGGDVMRETGVTRFLDFIRHLIQIAGTVTVLYLSWATVPWPLALILAIPVYLAMSGFADFLTLPLYFLTPEHKVISVSLNAIEEGDFSTALTVLKAHEKWHVTESQASPNIVTTEVCRMGSLFAHAASTT
jgi:hypothetical protein